jgi:hypothetical protein
MEKKNVFDQGAGLIKKAFDYLEKGFSYLDKFFGKLP